METTQNRTGFNRMVCDVAAEGGRLNIGPSDLKEWQDFIYLYNGSVGFKALQLDQRRIAGNTESSVIVGQHDAAMVENIERLMTNRDVGLAIGRLRPGDKIEVFIPLHENGPGVQYARVVCSARAKPNYMYNVQKTKTGCIIGLNSTVKVSARERINEMLREYEQPIKLVKVLAVASLNTARNYVSEYNEQNDTSFVLDVAGGVLIEEAEYTRPSGHVETKHVRAALRRVERDMKVTQREYDEIKRGFQEVLNRIKPHVE